MSADNDWPFEAWLKLAVCRFRLSPSEFWRMSVRDWLVLTRAERVPAMSTDELSALCIKFPDEVQNDTD